MSLIITHITIGITTCRRVSLGNTLISLSRLVLPLDTVMTIVVADEDDEPSAQTTVASLAAEYGLAITYLHTPAGAGFAALIAHTTGEYLAFIQDDSIADPAWLNELLSKQRSSNADVVLGAAEAIYAPGVPRWAVTGDFHSRRSGTTSTRYARNALMKRTSIHNDKTTYAYAPAARAYTLVQPPQATLRYLMPRFYAQGQAYAADLLLAGKWRFWHMPVAFIRLLKCYALMLLSCLSPLNRRRWLLRFTEQLAVLRTLWHNQPNPQ